MITTHPHAWKMHGFFVDVSLVDVRAEAADDEAQCRVHRADRHRQAVVHGKDLGTRTNDGAGEILRAIEIEISRRGQDGFRFLGKSGDRNRGTVYLSRDS